MTHFDNAYGRFELKRYPKAHDATLMAWDAADHLALTQLSEVLPQNGTALLANDEFGAMSIALSKHNTSYHWTDSLLSQIATQKNAENNTGQTIHYLSSDDPLPELAPDIIVLRVPKNLNLLNYQLQQLAHAYPQKNVLCCVMQKFITSGVKNCLNQYLDDLNPGRAVKKARLISGKLKPLSKPPEHLPFTTFEYDGLHIANLPNVFSSQSLDIGARFLLQNFPSLTDVKTLADLGCGNGILSVMAKSRNSNLLVTGFDESYMAVASAKESFKRNGFEDGQFTVSNCLSNAGEQQFDIILCNPPFHQNRRVTTDTAKLMFKQAVNHLTPKGELWVVANRHLGYEKSLKRLYARVEKVNQNHKFVILKASQ